jgi:hypothetical protein
LTVCEDGIKTDLERTGCWDVSFGKAVLAFHVIQVRDKAVYCAS